MKTSTKLKTIASSLVLLALILIGLRAIRPAAAPDESPSDRLFKIASAVVTTETPAVDSKHEYRPANESPNQGAVLHQALTLEEERRQRLEYLARPKGAYRENLERLIQSYASEGNTKAVSRLKVDLAEYDAMIPRGKAIADTVNMIRRKDLARDSKARREALVARRSNPEVWKQYRKNQPDSYATTKETRAYEALTIIRGNPRRTTARHFRHVADWMNQERRDSLDMLENGNPEDPHWHADRIEFIEESASLIGVELDAENEDWIAASLAELRRPYEVAEAQHEAASRESRENTMRMFYDTATPEEIPVLDAFFTNKLTEQ